LVVPSVVNCTSCSSSGLRVVNETFGVPLLLFSCNRGFPSRFYPMKASVLFYVYVFIVLVEVVNGGSCTSGQAFWGFRFCFFFCFVFLYFCVWAVQFIKPI
jgi:hypothetical protein